MKKIKIKILSWLLHHANRESSSEDFYAIKKKLLVKYGVFKQYDVQFISGKKCFSCVGTGVYHSVDLYSGREWSDTCWHCDGGWFKRPVWNILEKIQFGKYTFHQPWKRSYTKPDITVKPIEGFITHNYTKHGEFALKVLFFLFDRKRWWEDFKKNKPVNNFNKIIKIICNKFGKHKLKEKTLRGCLNDGLPF